MDNLFDILGQKVTLSVGSRDVEFNFYDLAWSSSILSIFYYLIRKSGFDNGNIKELKEQLPSEENPDDKPYAAKKLNIPTVKGWLCNVYRRISRSNLLRRICLESSVKQGNLDLFRQLILPEEATFYPIVLPETNSNNGNSEIDLWSLIKPSVAAKGFHFNTISDFIEVYRSGTVTPLEVARNIIAAIWDSETRSPKLRIIIDFHEEEILKLAAASTERWNENKPLSVFDGVPVAIKDEFKVGGHVTRGGSPIEKYGKECSISDEGGIVRKLREAGAMFIGVTNMHELGCGVTGINKSKHHGTPRNPYNINYPPGGSSGGSAAAVASGLCPIALGADGGGSIRIPSSVCGLVGAKDTFARISSDGLLKGPSTVGHAGALCATAQDATITYGFLAGPDPKCPLGMVQPPPSLNSDDLPSGLKCGVDWNLFSDCNPEILSCCKDALNYLVEQHGVKVVDISIPEYQESLRAHIITILTEMYSVHKDVLETYHDEINVETEANLTLAKACTGADYYTAQQQRTRCINIFKRLFSTVDCIITPSCGDFLPELSDEILKHGILDLKRTTSVMRYCSIGNLSGIPSITVPVGYAAKSNLPIGIMFQTPWWREDLMYQLASTMEGYITRSKPEVYYDVIRGVNNNVEESSGS